MISNQVVPRSHRNERSSRASRGLPLAAIACLLFSLTYASGGGHVQARVAATPSSGQEVPIGWIRGPRATQLYPAGKSNQISVVAVGELIDGRLPIVVRNNRRGRPLKEIQVRAIARTSSGKVLDIGSTDGIGLTPREVGRGDLAWGVILFDEVPNDAEVEFEFDLGARIPEPIYQNVYPFDLIRLEASRNFFVGEVHNPLNPSWGVDINTPQYLVIDILCVDSSATPKGNVVSVLDNSRLPPDESQEFQVRLPSELNGKCNSFMAAIYGVFY